MALMEFVKKQFIDILHWSETPDDLLAWRFPMQDMEIQNGARLVVRDAQLALFVNEGVLADVFAPGSYTLTTRTLPVLTNLRHWDKLFESPFKSDVYFFSTRLRLDRKWGTPNPVTIRDSEFGMVRLRAFGIYAYHLVDPKSFYRKVAGSREVCSGEELEGQLRNLLVAGLSQLFAEAGIAFVDMAAHQERLSTAMFARAAPMFAEYGLCLDTLAVENLSLPDELQKVLDQRIGMNMVGDLQRYAQYQVASSIPEAARNPGGVAAMGVGLGAAVGFGQAASQALGGATAPTADGVLETLEKLHALLEKGVLSQAEFDAKKTELLKKLV